MDLLIAILGLLFTAVGVIWMMFWGSRTLPEWWRGRKRYNRPDPDILNMLDEPPATLDSYPQRQPEPSMILYEDKGRLTTLSVSADGHLIAFAGFSGCVRILALQTGTVTEVAQHDSIVRIVRFHPVQNALASAGDDGLVRLTYIDSAEVRFIGKHECPVYSVLFDDSGEFLFSASRDGTIRTWEVAAAPVLLGHPTPRPPETTPVALQRHPEGCIFSLDRRPADRLLLSAGVHGAIYLWDPDGKTSHHLGSLKHTVFCASFARRGTLIAAGVADGTIWLWQRPECESTRLTGHLDAVRCVAFDGSGRFLASASKDRTVRIWDCTTKRCWILSGHIDYVYAVEFHPIEHRLFSVAGDGTLRSWTLPVPA